MTETGHTAPTVTVHHPAKPGSTITVTAKAYASVYAGEGYVMGRDGEAVVDQQGVQALSAQNAALQAELAALRASSTGASSTATAAAPAPRAPRKRAPRKAAAAPAAPAPSTDPAPGPADIGSTSPLDS